MSKNKHLSMAGLLLISGNVLHADEGFAMDDIVITATQNPTLNANETPLLVDVISSEAMAQENITALDELFEQTPGVDAKTAGPGSVMPMIRGLSDEQVLVLVDGVRLSDERPGGNHVLSITPAQIERMEVVKGPGSVLYGAGAIGGVVNFITKKGHKGESDTLELHGEATVGYESNQNAKEGSVHIEADSKSLSFYLGGDKRKTDNIESPNEEIKFSNYDGETVWGGVAYYHDQWSVELNAWQNVADIGITAPRSFYADYYKNETQKMVDGKVTYNANGELLDHFELQLGWQEHNRHRIRQPQSDQLTDIHVDKISKTARAQWVLKPNDIHRITTGLDTFDESLTSSRIMENLSPAATFSGVPVIAPSSRTGMGVFAQDEIAVDEKIKVTTGLRYDTIESQTQGATSPYFITEKQSVTNDDVSGSLGIVYKQNDTTNFYANIGRAFRSPTLIERYFFGPHDGPGLDLGNPDLKPETSLNTDIGVRLSKAQYSASVGVFYNSVNNMIRHTLTNPEAEATEQVYEYLNIQDARLYGIEFDGNYYLTDAVSLFGSLSFIDGEDTTTHQPLTAIAPLKSRYGIEYYGEVGDYQWISGLSAQSVMKKEKDELGIGEKASPGYTTVNLYSSLMQDKGVSAFVSVENLFNRTTYDFLSYGYQALDYAAMGRNVKFTLRYAF